MCLVNGFSLVWLFLGRLVLYRFRQAIHAQGVGVNRLAVVGNYDTRVKRFINVLNAKTNSGYKFVGVINATVGTDDSDAQYLGKNQEILELIRMHRLDTLFIVSPTVPNDMILKILHACEGMPVQINLLPELSEFIRDGRETITQTCLLYTSDAADE